MTSHDQGGAVKKWPAFFAFQIPTLFWLDTKTTQRDKGLIGGHVLKNYSILSALFLFSIPSFGAGAKILATDGEHKTVKFALDSKGTPRIDNNPKTYPTIKDFREDGDYEDACYIGETKEVKALLEALVDAANGDGDSFAELKSIKQSAQAKFTVRALITNEGGKKEEVYVFLPCKTQDRGNVTVECKTTEGKVHKLKAKLTSKGKLVRWDNKRFVEADSKSIFHLFATDQEETGVEYSKEFQAKNGYSIVVLGTTADEHTLGISLEKLDGFFQYKDLGSGSGNSKEKLSCKKL